MNVVILNAWQMLLKGGPMMWPILLLSIVTLAIVINRLLFLQAQEKIFTAQRQMLLESLRQGKLKDTLKLAENNPGVASHLVKAGIIRSGASTELVRLSMEEVWAHEEISFKHYMPMLGIIVNVAPLLGLLGTVNSMTVVFHASVVRSNILNPTTAGELASGIWQALLTTTAGLVVGIFAYVAYSFCAMRMSVYTAWANHLIVETTHILISLKEAKYDAQQ